MRANLILLWFNHDSSYSTKNTQKNRFESFQNMYRISSDFTMVLHKEDHLLV